MTLESDRREDAAAPRGAGLLRLADAETITAKERRDVVILADREALTITWSRYAAGEQGPGPHVHREHTDAFYVLEGELTFAVGPRAERARLTAREFVAVPPNVVHAFANEGDAEARWLNFHAPDKGFAAYLRAAPGGSDAAWDSFDAPADGGLPADGVVVTRAGDGERVRAANGGAAVLKCVLPELIVAEWTLDGRDLPDRRGHWYELDGAGRFLGVHAPDAGFAESLRRGSD